MHPTLSRVEVTHRDAMRELIEHLVAYNHTVAPPEGHEWLLFTLRDPDGTFLGGVGGNTHWGWLFISHLWVSEALRGQGWGQRLVAEAEREAVRRGCRHAHLDTFSFQALGFYERLGYVQFGCLEDYPAGSGHRRYYLVKRDLPAD